MTQNEQKACYLKGIEIGFVRLKSINHFGTKNYEKCPGEENTPGIIGDNCQKCEYLDKNHAIKRAKQLEKLRFERNYKIKVKLISIGDRFYGNKT